MTAALGPGTAEAAAAADACKAQHWSQLAGSPPLVVPRSMLGTQRTICLLTVGLPPAPLPAHWLTPEKKQRMSH